MTVFKAKVMTPCRYLSTKFYSMTYIYRERERERKSVALGGVPDFIVKVCSTISFPNLAGHQNIFQRSGQKTVIVRNWIKGKQSFL